MRRKEEKTDLSLEQKVFLRMKLNKEKLSKRQTSSLKRSQNKKYQKLSNSKEKSGSVKSSAVLVDDKNVTFENLNINTGAEQGFGDLISPENEIINYETNLHPEFKGDVNLNDKNKSKKKKRKTRKGKLEHDFKATHTFNAKKKEIDKILGPLGDGITTDLLDFENIHNVPDDKIKGLKLSKADQEYFSGSKTNFFLPQKSNKIFDKFSDDGRHNKNDCPLSK